MYRDREGMMPFTINRVSALLAVPFLFLLLTNCGSTGTPGTISTAAGTTANTSTDTYTRIVATIKAGDYAGAEQELRAITSPYAEPDSMTYGCKFYLEFKRGNMQEAFQLAKAASHADPEFSTIFLGDTGATNLYVGALLNDHVYANGQATSGPARLAVRETERMISAFPSVEAKALNISARYRVIQYDQADDQYPALLADAKQLAQQYPHNAGLANQVADLTRNVDGPAAAVAWRDKALAQLPASDNRLSCSILYERGTDLMLSSQWHEAIDNYHELLRRAGVEGQAGTVSQSAPEVAYAVKSTWLGLARAHGELGEIDKCIEYLKKTEYRGVSGGNFIRQDMYLKHLSGNAEFQRFLNEHYGR